MLVSTRIRGTVSGGRLVVFERDPQGVEGVLGIVQREVSAQAEHELHPELLLFCEELAEALEKLAILDSTWRVIWLLALAWWVLDGTVERSDACFEDRYEGVRGLHPQSSLGIFGLPRVGMNEEQAEVLTTETGDQLVVARGET